MQISIPIYHRRSYYLRLTVPKKLRLKDIITQCMQFVKGDAVNNDDSNVSSENNFKMTEYLVTNSEFLRMRYLLVYAKQPTSIRFSSLNANRNGE